MTKLRAFLRAILPPRHTFILDALIGPANCRYCDKACRERDEARADLKIVLDAIDKAVS